ncbi:hypothetical protein DVH24_041364 [Malus domestica]|uniref:Uncharacterized protein n=1 Tax=Malus domestica TaxID=3750 RepID=A0A498IDW6_MALDO|nr:hypothetical protein DVH24_041364 [Malus domestica]
MCGQGDKIKNEHIRGKVGVVTIEDKMRKNWFRWFRHILWLGNAIMRHMLREKIVEKDLEIDFKKRYGMLGANGKLGENLGAVAF